MWFHGLTSLNTVVFAVQPVKLLGLPRRIEAQYQVKFRRVGSTGGLNVAGELQVYS